MPAPPSAAPLRLDIGRMPIPALAVWREKLEFLLEQEPLIVDAAQKFALRKQIEEARRKIQELGG